MDKEEPWTRLCVHGALLPSGEGQKTLLLIEKFPKGHCFYRIFNNRKTLRLSKVFF